MVAGLLVASLAVSIPAAASSEIDTSDTRSTAEAADIALIAEGHKWTVAEASAQRRAEQAVEAVAVLIAESRPEIFVGSALATVPGDPPTLYIKGPGDEWVLTIVREAGADIILADNQPFSFDELESRKVAVHQAIVALGFDNVVSSFDLAGKGVIDASVAIDAESQLTARDILGALPADVADHVRLTVMSPASFGDTATFGGLMVTSGGGNYATSGWTVGKVVGNQFVTGVTTAGHATGADGITHPVLGPYTFVFQSEHRGQWGDIEWHTTNTSESPLFYASPTDVRSVLSIEPRAGISVNEDVCQYGRFSNVRHCGPRVQNVSIACTLSGVFNDRLVRMDQQVSIPGDSGGGWSFANTAFGSQKGHCGGLDAWSVVDLFDEALGVIPIVDVP